MTKPLNANFGEDNFAPYIQPYVRLTQRNTQLFMQFAASPEMVSLWMKNSQSVFKQAVHKAAGGKADHEDDNMAAQAHSNLSEVGKSKAFAGFMQGLMESQMQFFVDLAQANMATLQQGPAKMVEQLQHAASQTIPMPSAEERPSRSSKRKE